MIILEDCVIEEMTGEELKGLDSPMIVYSIPDTSTVISNSKYKVWINYRDGWGCTYANVKKWEEINGE